jgi:hypothetical protein
MSIVINMTKQASAKAKQPKEEENAKDQD